MTSQDTSIPPFGTYSPEHAVNARPAEGNGLLPCPFCGCADIDPTGWASTDREGPACNECSASADTVERWNTRPRAALGGE